MIALNVSHRPLTPPHPARSNTGTLTCNTMEFSNCSIAGVKYGCSLGESPPEQANQYQEANFNFYDRLASAPAQCNPGLPCQGKSN